MNLLIADTSVVKAMSRRRSLPRLGAPGRRILMWDFIASWVLCDADAASLRRLAPQVGASSVIVTAFAGSGREVDVLSAEAAPSRGPNPLHDYGLLAAWAAAALAEDIRTGRRSPAEFVALAEEALVVQVLSDAGVTVRDADWVGAHETGT